MKKLCICLIIPVIIWMIVVFMFSSQGSVASENTSATVIKAILSIVSPDNVNNSNLIESLQGLIRKLAHFTLYLVGGMLIYTFINVFNTTTKFKIILSIALGAAYAVTDELHQLFVYGRTGKITDVFIDTSGVALGVGIIVIIVLLVNRYKRKEYEFK